MLVLFVLVFVVGYCFKFNCVFVNKNILFVILLYIIVGNLDVYVEKKFCIIWIYFVLLLNFKFYWRIVV